MPSAPYDFSISAARVGALFASPLQRSDEPSARQVRRAIATAIGHRRARRAGLRGPGSRRHERVGDAHRCPHTSSVSPAARVHAWRAQRRKSGTQPQQAQISLICPYGSIQHYARMVKT